MKKLSLLLIALLATSSLVVKTQENIAEQNKVIEVARDLKKAAMHGAATITLQALKDVFGHGAYRAYLRKIIGGVDKYQIEDVLDIGLAISRTLYALCMIQSASYIFSAVYKAVGKNSQKKETLVSE